MIGSIGYRGEENLSLFPGCSWSWGVRRRASCDTGLEITSRSTKHGT